MRFSIIINNYNYARYLRQAIDSALAVAWPPDKEVIVVDDGSTDESRDIIASYGDRIIAVLQENGGQNSAANAGFAVSTGDLVLFLDSDDALLTDVGDAVMKVFTPEVAKIQFNAMRIDKDGKEIGPYGLLARAYSPEAIRGLFRDTGSYPSPSTSCIAWSREFLWQILPMPTRSEGRAFGRFFDDYLSMLAPFFGEVVTLTSMHTLYRIHGANSSGEMSGILGGDLSLAAMARTFEEERDRVDAVNATLMRLKSTTLSRSGINPEEQLDHMANFLLYKRFRAGEYEANAKLATVFVKYLRALSIAEGGIKRKLKLIAWASVIATAPKKIATRAAAMRARQRTGGFTS